MKNLRRLLLVLLAGAPLLYLPLRAAEPQDPPPAQLPPADTPPASVRPADAPPTSGSESPVAADEAAAAPEEPEDFGERVSADNNLSFPVDI
jgi:hypothetical protein